MRRDDDVGVASLAQDAPNARLVGESEGSGVLRAHFRQGRRVFGGCAQRRDHPRVLPRLAPAGEGEPSARSKAAPDIGEGERRIGEEHDAETRDDEIRPVGRLVHGGVRKHETRRQIGLGALAGARQHGLGNVEAQNLAAGRDAPREVDRRRPAAAADVDHPFAWFRVRHRYEALGDGLQHLVLVVLTVPPALPGGTVPVVGLGHVTGMDQCVGHVEIP